MYNNKSILIINLDNTHTPLDHDTRTLIAMRATPEPPSTHDHGQTTCNGRRIVHRSCIKWPAKMRC